MHGIARLINRGPCPLRRASIQFLQKHYDIQNRSLFMGKVRLSRSFMNQFKNVYNLPPAPIEITPTISQTQFNAETVHAVGYLVKVDSLSKELVFARMVGTSGRGETLQLITRNPQICQQLRDAVINSPISIAGKFRLKKSNVVAEQAQSTKPSSHRREDVSIKSLEIDLLELTCLNSFPHHIRVAKDQVFLPEHRHMQIRYDFGLRERLAFRSDVAKAVREYLHDFQEVETPILFKSTPEGAKEFLVPSRKYGHAYALPQSPQQYKQILMASGIEKYLQFARCFRDEDLRADRQPEFTQIDIELAFAGGNKVMRLAEGLIKYIYHKFSDRVPAINIEKKGSCQQENFPVMTYDHAMSYHGTDKPDTRITGLITQINEATSIDLCTMLTTIADPIIECCKLRLNASPNEIKRFINNFMKSPDAEPFISNPDGAPGFAYYDTSKPLSGLQIFGFEGAATLKKIYEQKTRVHYEDDQIYAMEKEFAEGDLFLIQARPNLSHSGGSTSLGLLRRALYKAAVECKLVEPDKRHHYLWVTEFPMFTLDSIETVGQDSNSGLHATHHPFTAPKTEDDVDMLSVEPLKARADHYDLVVNGIELGGGSRRIHLAEMQKYVMRDVLKMSSKRMDDFSHLLGALAAGCPPHAGIALGFDRLIAVLTNKDSIKDVIAFPKSSKGDDLMVKSPSKISDVELARYHILLKIM
ncbi:unnamed protein product [Blumeria hordei]|uniref:Aminoacyl-transfer RNA synthetases class-II family profile domain-containing protein n=2 Tax=Blumeria hordei TaxID=2867405 RepID=A0A383UK10_BLUHO|nr:unnamed protein product [Blumeria hordei]